MLYGGVIKFIISKVEESNHYLILEWHSGLNIQVRFFWIYEIWLEKWKFYFIWSEISNFWREILFGRKIQMLAGKNFLNSKIIWIFQMQSAANANARIANEGWNLRGMLEEVEISNMVRVKVYYYSIFSFL